MRKYTFDLLIGWFWIILGFAGVLISIIQLVGLLVEHNYKFYGPAKSFVLSSLLALLFVVAGIGFIRYKKWAQILGIVLLAIIFLYCISFLIFVGPEFGTFVLLAIFCLLLFSGACFFIILKKK